MAAIVGDASPSTVTTVMGTALAPTASATPPAGAGTSTSTGLGWATVAAVGLTLTTYVAVNPGGWAPFVTARWWCVSTLGALTAGIAWWAARREPGPLIAPIARWAWAALLVALTLAALTNGDAPTAVLGEPARHLGLVTWLLLAVVFVAGAVIGRGQDGPARRRALAVSLVAATGLAGVWSVVELVVGPPIDVAVATDRLLGPFGSAAYLGAACCLGLPVAVGLAADPTSRRLTRVVALAALAVGTVAVVGSGSRAAWCALAITTIASAVAVRGRDRRDHERPAADRSMLGASVAGAAIVGITAFLALGPGLDTPLDRAHGPGSRLDEWRVAVDVLATNPLGVGPEGYRIAIAEGVDDAYERRYDRDDTLPDRAHSGPLDVALAGGVVAGAAWLVLQAHLARRCWRALRSARGGRVAVTDAGLAAGVVAYGVGQLLLFPIGELEPVWWLVAGAVVAMPAADAPVGTPAAGRAERGVRIGRARARALVALGCLAATVVAGLAGIAGVAADRLAGDAVRHASDDPYRARRDAARASELRPDDTHLRLLAATTARATPSLVDLDRAISTVRAARSFAPHDPEVRELLGVLLLDRALATGDEADIAAAVDHWREAIGVDPHRADWQLHLGRSLALADDADGAAAAWARAAALDPDDPRPPALLAGIAGIDDR